MTVKLHYGDNIDWLGHLPADSVDLCYIDPPFNSDVDYNIMVGGAQEKAFSDIWSWTIHDDRLYKYVVEHDGKVGSWAEGMMYHISRCGVFSYLLFMAVRLVEIRRVLKDTGSIYLHCDDSMGHHLRVLMDAVFGQKNWRNSIVWHYTGGLNAKKSLPCKHDTILYYTKSDDWTFNLERVPYAETSGYAKSGITSKTGKKYMPNPEGKPIDDVWDIPIINPMAKERVGYPTQKPLALLERIVLASSNPGDLVMDCFLGSGTTGVASVKNGRNFIGCDLTHKAVKIAQERIGVECEITGNPACFEDADPKIR